MKLIDLLLGFQRKAASTVARFLILLWSRQTGKGYTTSFVASRGAEIEPRSNWLIVAPTERQSLETLDKCKNWIKAAHLSVSETEEEFDALEKGAKIKAKVIVLSNGSKIYALPGKPASLRGFTGYLVIDEFAFFEDQKEVWKAVFAVIVNPMASIKRVIITSTPNGQGDMFHKLVDENFLNPKEGRRIKWEVQKVTIHEAAKAWEEAGKLGTVIDEKTGEERPKTAEEYVEETREAFDCPEAWPQEFECEFLDASANLLSFDMITAAESVEATEHGFDPDEPGEFYGGFDFGGIKDPSIFWYAKKVGDRLITRDVLTLRETDTGEQLAAVRSRIDKCIRVCVDYTGPGRGFGDVAANGIPGTDFGGWGEYDADPKKFLSGKIEKVTFSEPSKRELFTPFRLCFGKEPKFIIPHADWIRQDFHGVQMILKGKEYVFWAPRMSNGHSDGACAAALCRRAASFGGGYVPPPRVIVAARPTGGIVGSVRNLTSRRFG
jgi:phage FluMu gp28-like protein